jgi:hypothetical protein
MAVGFALEMTTAIYISLKEKLTELNNNNNNKIKSIIILINSLIIIIISWKKNKYDLG